MTLSKEPHIIVGLPGAGFDASFIESAFAPLSDELGAELWSVTPQPGRIIDSYMDVCQKAARTAPFIAVGISVGAIALAQWAVKESSVLASSFKQNCQGLIIVMAPWTAHPTGTSPAALYASNTAQLIQEKGFKTVRDIMSESSPQWLVELQEPCWNRLGEDLQLIFNEVSVTEAPTVIELEQITVPCGVLGVRDDPTHPWEISREWAQHIPGAVYSQISLNDIAHDVTVLSTAARVLNTHL